MTDFLLLEKNCVKCFFKIGEKHRSSVFASHQAFQVQIWAFTRFIFIHPAEIYGVRY